jgi:hypothetical protein
MRFLIARLIDAVLNGLFPAESALIDRLTDDRDPVDDEFHLAAAVLWPATPTTLPTEA